MAKTGRVTVTLPTELIRTIDRIEPNRSRFVAEAVENEVRRRREDRLNESLNHPHPETLLIAESGVQEWGSRLPDEEEGLVDAQAGRAVRWSDESGWVEQ